MKSRRGRYVRFTTTMLSRLVHLREGERRTYAFIAIDLGVPESTVHKQYKQYLGRKDVPPARQTDRAIAIMQPPTTEGVVERPRLPSSAEDIMRRIATQGITAGLFGDPPAGRSALDRRRSA